MSRCLSLAIAVIAGALWSAPADAGKLNLGREATAEEIKGWDIDIRPDGQGLPEGKGTVTQGDDIYQERCASCHGVFGEGLERWPVLAGGQGSLKSERPVKTIGSFWPYLSTVYDYIYRAMPFGDAQSLSADETYAIVAYLLFMNDLVDGEFELNKSNFASIRLPNEKNFVADPRHDRGKHPAGKVCMKNCKAKVEITKRARVVDVTPAEKKPPPAKTE